MYLMAARQSLLGVCYQGVCRLPREQQPPMDLVLQWLGDAESISGLNRLLNDEAARLTRVFAEKGHKTAILKGQANAIFYPDPMSRQPGDIDIWVEGGKKRVMALLPDAPKPSYHHVHLPPNENGIVVEVHFRPSSGNYNPVTNYRLQRWLNREIQTVTIVEQGFCVPTMQFALMMQLAHIQRHFLGSGVGLRQICDYCQLLRAASDIDRQAIASLTDRFGLRPMAGALMWVLDTVLHMDSALMLCEPDQWRGEWLLREIMAGGNFGWYAKREQYGVWRRFFSYRRRRLHLLRFDFWEVLWQELKYWKQFFVTTPQRFKYKTLSLREFPGHRGTGTV